MNYVGLTENTVLFYKSHAMCSLYETAKMVPANYRFIKVRYLYKIPKNIHYAQIRQIQKK